MSQMVDTGRLELKDGDDREGCCGRGGGFMFGTHVYTRWFMSPWQAKPIQYWEVKNESKTKVKKKKLIVEKEK